VLALYLVVIPRPVCNPFSVIDLHWPPQPIPSCLHRRHAENLAPLLLAQLGAYDAIDARANGVASLVDEHTGVVVKLDHAAVGPLHPVLCPHDDGVPDVAPLDLVRCRHAGHALGHGSALLLDDDHDAVSCAVAVHHVSAYDSLFRGEVVSREKRRQSKQTYCGKPLLSHNLGAFDNGRARIVDAVEHRLWQGLAADLAFVERPFLFQSVSEKIYL